MEKIPRRKKRKGLQNKKIIQELDPMNEIDLY